MNKINKLKLFVAILIIFTPIICDDIVFIRNNHMGEQYIYVSLVITGIIGLSLIYRLLDK